MPEREGSRRRWFDPLGPAASSAPQSSSRAPVAPVGSALRALAAKRGWQSHLVAGELHAGWDEVVGPQLAAHTAPLRLQGGVLVLAAESALWAAEVRQLGAVITEQVNARLGAETVTRITVSVRRPKTR
jgi:predicted nucleic acid-binding Zn ribbon protein